MMNRMKIALYLAMAILALAARDSASNSRITCAQHHFLVH